MSNLTGSGRPSPSQRAAAELEYRRRTRLKSEQLVDFIPRISPRYTKPYHLAPLLDALKRTETEAVRAVCSVPPRFAKTETMLHAIAYRLQRRPWETIAYVTYGDRLAKTKSRLARIYAQRAGIQFRPDAQSLDEWRTHDLGGALFTSIGGAFVGQGANVIIIDDPHAGRAEAESSVERQSVWDWYQGVGSTRLEPGGSIVLTHTRWHPEDLTGCVLQHHAHENWERIRFPALNDRGESLWPERWSAEDLDRRRLSVGEYEWAAQFMGEPRPRGGAVFKDVRFYDPAKVPAGLRISVGIDLAYSGKTKSDWSACVVLGERDEKIYVLAVAREQRAVPQFAEIVRQLVAPYPGAAIHWHTSTTEAGVAQLLQTIGLNVKHELAKADKFTRSLPCAAAWNDARILVPGGKDANGEPVAKPHWVDDFVREVTSFTGQGDRHDDQVDAFASGFEAIRYPSGKATSVSGAGSRWGADTRGWG